jgi:hypothetical protein
VVDGRIHLVAKPETLSLAAARRVAIAAQGFTDRTHATPGRQAIRRVFDRVGVVQIDSVNVLSRSHYLPFFSRLGPYSRDVLDRTVNRKPRLAFEYWAHEASLVPVELQPSLRWRMERADDDSWGRMQRIARDRPDLVPWVLDEVRRQGPITPGQIEDDAQRPTDHWGWNWTDVKTVLEYLFWAGQVTSAGRNGGFARRYDLSSRVLPAEIAAAPTPSRDEAMRTLILVAARAHGIGTERCLRDYFRLPASDAKRAVAELVEAGALLPVTVKGWNRPTYLHHQARTPRKVTTRALLSPFDSLVWERMRVEELFGFRYRLEIYVPKEKRVHGYYVLPFLLGDRLVARVDLKADRQAGMLRVQSAWREPDAPSHSAEELVAELRSMAEWMGLSDVVSTGRGDLPLPLPTAPA